MRYEATLSDAMRLSGAIAVGALAGAGCRLGLGGAPGTGDYVALLAGAVAGLFCLAILNSRALSREGRTANLLLAGMLGAGLLAVGIGGWLKPTPDTGATDLLTTLATATFAIGLGILVSFGGIFGVWLALRPTPRDRAEPTAPSYGRREVASD